MKIVFMGTPEFAIPSLRQLIQSNIVVGIISQPDRPHGRGRKLAAPPVKKCAEEFGIDGQDIDNIELAVDEACANVIEHGYTPDAPDKHITIRMEIDPGKLVLTIIDQGERFDPRLREQPDIKQLIEMKRLLS